MFFIYLVKVFEMKSTPSSLKIYKHKLNLPSAFFLLQTVVIISIFENWLTSSPSSVCVGWSFHIKNPKFSGMQVLTPLTTHQI